MLKKQLSENESSIQSDLGDGKHGHLGLILSNTEFQSLTQTTYKFPNHPGELVLSEDATQCMQT